MKNIREHVKDQYSKVVTQSDNALSCCATNTCQEGFNESYKGLEGYNPEADYGLGCGLPTKFAKLKPGQTVLDLGSGAGNDCFIARKEVGKSGKVYGLDFSEAMTEKAKENALKLGYKNVEFILGDIENIPLQDNSVDVVVSNCVLNLVPDKEKVFSNIYDVLKPKGHFSISDVVTTSKTPKRMISDPDLFSDCISGAMPKQEYLQEIKNAGFKNITIQKERELKLPQYAKDKFEIPENFKVLSLTICAEKY